MNTQPSGKKDKLKLLITLMLSYSAPRALMFAYKGRRASSTTMKVSDSTSYIASKSAQKKNA